MACSSENLKKFFTFIKEGASAIKKRVSDRHLALYDSAELKRTSPLTIDGSLSFLD